MSRLSNLLESNFRSKSQEILLEISGKKYSWADIDVISNHVAHKVVNTITIRPSVLFINLGLAAIFCLPLLHALNCSNYSNSR